MSNPDFNSLFEEEPPAKPKGLLKTNNQVPKEPVKQTELKDLDLEVELLAQYKKAQALLDDADKEPLNQKAQTLNSITLILQAIIKSQQDLYNIERLKTLENTLIKVLQDFPEIKHQFLDAYEKELKKLWAHLPSTLSSTTCGETMTNVKSRMTKEQYSDLVNYRRRIKDIAKELNVTANYLGKMVKERAPKRNPKVLKRVRMLFQYQIAREILEGKHTIKEGSNIACISERTMFRRLAKVRNDYIKAIGED